MKQIRKFINFIIWAVVAIYIVVTVFFHIPVFQSFIGGQVASALAGKLGTRVEIGRVDLGFLNRLVIDNVRVYDQRHRLMLSASRVSAKADIIPIFEGKISISSAQLFGMTADLYRMSPDAKPNFQFVVDSLSSKDTTSHTPLDLSINSLVVRNGNVRWNDYSKRKKEGLDINHLSVSNLSTHILLNRLTDNGIDVAVKRLSLKESSGLDLRQFAFKFKADKKSASLTKFTIELPNTRIYFPVVHADYRTANGKIDKKSLRYRVLLDDSKIAPADLAFVEPMLRSFKNTLNVRSEITGSADNIDVGDIAIDSDDESIRLRGNGGVSSLSGTPKWRFRVTTLKTDADGVRFVARNLRKHNVGMPDVITRLGDINFKGEASGEGKRAIGKGELTTGAGSLTFDGNYNKGLFKASVRTKGADLRRILDNNDFGNVIADVYAEGYIPSPFKLDKLDVVARANVGQFDYRGYSYHNINVDGNFRTETFNGKVSINDPNGKVVVDGTINKARVLATLTVDRLNLHNMKLTDALGNRTFGFAAKANLSGSDLDHLNGSLGIDNFTAVGEGKSYNVGHLQASVRNNFRKRSADVEGDFGDIHIDGTYDYQTLPNSFISIADHHLPSLFAKRRHHAGNRFSVSGNLVSASIVRQLFGVPLSIKGPVSIWGDVDDTANKVNLHVNSPYIVYDGNDIHDVRITADNTGGILSLHAEGKRLNDDGVPFSIIAEASANDDDIVLNGLWSSGRGRRYHGAINTKGQLFRNGKDGLGVSLDILPSEEVFDTIKVAVLPSHLTYSRNMLDIEHFQVMNGEQYVSVNGQTTGSDEDSLMVDFRNINLRYILDLVGFNSVIFTGLVTGKGYVKSFFKNPTAYADFDVDDFRFQGGEFGTLHAHATYDNTDKRISFTSVADDGPGCSTDINGYVSIKEHYLDIPMVCHGTKMEFLEGFAGAVMENVTATGNGTVRIFGDLSKVNMEGDVVCDGDIGIKQTNVVYTMRRSPVRMRPNEIVFANDSVYDRDGNLAIVSGGLHHNNFHNWTFDVHVDADGLLCLNLPEFGDNTFRGVIYGSGECDIIGRSDGTAINANITPDGKSFMEYNAGYSGSLDDNSFIHWGSVNPSIPHQASPKGRVSEHLYNDSRDTTGTDVQDNYNHTLGGEMAPVSIPSDFTMNLLVNTTPDFTLRVLMDSNTGDHMDFHGSGVVRATYFNKGAFQMFGNYDVQYGDYTMTIQNLVKKVFTFQEGSSITFNGSPFDAAINLKAQYTVNGVSLSDLQMGRSFTSNTIRVNCLMDITGTPLKPSVTFGLDLPTLSSDAQQMVRSVMNSEEDMNQQVLYLLAIGRFYNPGNNNAEVERTASQSQTSLAMQSVLSGTLSQQINNVLSTVIHNNNWNFGANIVTGDEGWSDAEYEGLLSGRMLNNRLLFQGQFGYRDKVTTDNSSFIGDFDMRYLLTPNGNAAIRVYNQTNDRYFTRNSLTTQGLGFIFKKDFNNFKDLFHSGKTKKKKKTQASKQKKSKKR